MSTGIILQDARDYRKYHSLRADFVTGAPPIIDNDHAYIHEGKAFGAWYYQATSGTAQLVFLLTTPAATEAYKYVHFRPAQVSTDSPIVTIKVYENTTGLSAGTAITLVNRNRNSSRVSNCTLTHTPTGSLGTPTQIDQQYIGGGTGQGQSKSGDTIQGIHELIFKPDTKYAITIDFGTADTKIGIEFFMYVESEG